MQSIKEKTADELFSELGYEKEERKYAEVFILRNKYFIKQIGFNKESIAIMTDVEFLSIYELQAINKKCKELRMGKVVSKKYKKRLKLKPDFEEYLNAIYDCYVLEKDENLDKGARELKYSYMYVIDNMILHDCLEEIKC